MRVVATPPPAAPVAEANPGVMSGALAAVSAAPAPVSAPVSGPVPTPTVTEVAAAPQPGSAAIALPLPLPETGTGLGGLPLLPPTPRFSAEGYPACREEYQAVPDGIARIEAINRCTAALDSYFKTSLTGYRETMARHQDTISRLYTDKVGGTGRFEPALQDRFYAEMMKEHADSKPDGAHFATHRATEARYHEDRAYMADRYCFMTGCNGYPPRTYYKDPVPPAKPGK